MVKFVEKKRTAFLGLPIYFTTYTITEDLLNVRKGLFKVVEDDCFLYKIQDVTMTMTLIERIFGLSTIVCHTGDNTSPILELKHIKHGRVIKDYLVRTSDEERMKRRTINTVNIDAEDVEDGSVEE